MMEQKVTGADRNIPEGHAEQRQKELELYLHIPFCVRKCNYCDFLSGPATDRAKRDYMNALRRELAEAAGGLAEYQVSSIFFGGGTPSCVDGEEIVSVMQCIREQYHISQDAEITIEVNPGTVDRKKLSLYRECGINRLSIGLQSADEEELALLGRIHDWRAFQQTYEEAVGEGFTNINVDLMTGLPGQTLEASRNTLQKVLSLQPAPRHISAYSLILEEGTELYQRVEEGKLEPLDEEQDRAIYEQTGKVLQEAGYERYEISNYARAGAQCRHNCGYWTGVEYRGFGIGAASYTWGVRYRNGESLEKYLENPSHCIVEEQKLTIQDKMEEFMFLGLRMTCGISCEDFEMLFHESIRQIYGNVIRKNVEDGLLECVEMGGQSRIRLTAKGLDLSNYVMAQFLLE